MPKPKRRVGHEAPIYPLRPPEGIGYRERTAVEKRWLAERIRRQLRRGLQSNGEAVGKAEMWVKFLGKTTQPVGASEWLATRFRNA